MDYDNLKENKIIKEVSGLVRITDMDDKLVVDLRYATENNFTKKGIYPSAVCLLQKATAEKLIKANKEFAKRGLRLKIWDAYRPVYVQQIFWDLVGDPRFVADPKKGSKHSRGIAVDVTLVDKDGNEIEMPTGFDDFSVKASRSHKGNSKEAQQNMEYLTEVMKRNGFVTISSEWWHYEDSDRDKYKELDIRLEEFE
jgi:D-alanyl-D-alanine dipeptidase